MDDLIYFVLLIGWLAFSFYQQSVKKKKKQAQMQAAQERDLHGQDEFEVEEDLDQAYKTQIEAEEPADIKSVLENFLMGGQTPLEAKPSRQEVRQASIEAEEHTEIIEEEKNVYQKYYDEELVRGEAFNDDDAHYNEELEEDSENEKMTIESISHFDLRRAVIYAEILNRPYAN